MTTKKALAAFLAVVLLMGIASAFPGVLGTEAYSYQIGTITANSVYVRSGPGYGYTPMTTLTRDETCMILDADQGSDDLTWYYVRSNWGYEGFVSSEYVNSDSLTLNGENVPDLDTFLSSLRTQGFPESYLPGLLYLHWLYPQWRFSAVQTGLDWAASVKAEGKIWSSMVEPNCLSSWKSTQEGAYNWSTGKWIGLDGSWVQASDAITAYYMDPRNFFSSTAVFQFLSQRYDGAEDGSDREIFLTNLRTMLAGTFLYPSEDQETLTYENNDETINFVNAFYETGKATGVSPYTLASMVLVEQGTTGSTMVDGDVSGYENLYNYFNIGAYTTSSMSATQRGLWYARGGDSGATGYSRPWNTRYKSLQGGAEFYADQYVSAGQYTLYFKRFNVCPSSPEYLYAGQYMASAYGAAIEGCINSRGYSEEMRAAELVFYIPVYENMPDIVSMPLRNGSPNNKLSSLTVSGATLTPTFSPDTESYSMVISGASNTVTISAVPVDKNADVYIGSTLGTSATVRLSGGDNRVNIRVTAENGDVREYTLTITYRGDGEYTELYRLSSDGAVTGIEPGTDISSFLTDFHFGDDATVSVLSADGTEKGPDALVGTGDVLKAVLPDSTMLQYTAVLYGDINGDGLISNADRIKIRNHVLGAGTLGGVYFSAADVNRDGSVSNADRIGVRNFVLGTGSISQ